MAAADEAARYRENCSLFSTRTVPQFETALRTQSTECKLSGLGLDDAAMVCISESLRSNTTIRELDVSNNAFSQSGAQDLAAALAENSSITSAKLRDNNIGDDGVAAICSALAANPNCRVECVDCRATGLTSTNLSKAMERLTHNRTLTALNLESNGLTAEAGDAIAKCLAENVTLKVLCLGSNYLGDVGVKAVCHGLVDSREGSQLCLLDVSRNGVRTEGAAALASVIRSHHCPLTELLLAYNPLGAAGCAAIAASLRDRVSSPAGDFPLRYLDVTGVEMGREGEDALANAVTAILERLGSTANAHNVTADGSPPFVVDGLDDRAGQWRAATSTLGGVTASPAATSLPGTLFNRSMATSVGDVAGPYPGGPGGAGVPSVPVPPPPPPPSLPTHPGAAHGPSGSGPTTDTAAVSERQRRASRLNSVVGSMVTGVGLGRESVVGTPTSFLHTQGLVDALQQQIEDQSQQITELKQLLTGGGRGEQRPSRGGSPQGGSALAASASTVAAAASGRDGEPVQPQEWGLHSTAMAASSMKRLKTVEDAVASLANEIRWVDEEGLKSRLDAEEELRARIDTLTARLDAMEDAEGFPAATRGGAGASGAPPPHGRGLPGRATLGRGVSGGNLTAGRGAAGSDNPPPIARETMARHIRVNEERILKLQADMDDMRSQLAAVNDTVSEVKARLQALESGPSDDATVVARLAERVNTAVKTMEQRLGEATASLHEASPEDVSAMVSKAVSSQLRGVASRLRGDIDKAVGVAMQTMQRTMDMAAAKSASGSRDSDAIAMLTTRLDVLEQTVTAEQEMSLTTLETIMRATQRAGGGGGGGGGQHRGGPHTTAAPPMAATASTGAGSSGGHGTGILSVAVATS